MKFKRKALLSLALCLSAAIATAKPAIVTLDGDTFKIGGETIRIANMDAPETIQAKCDAERRLGLLAKSRLDWLLHNGIVSIQRRDPVDGRLQDRHKRTLATIQINGQDVAQILIDEGLARPWEGKRKPWC